MKKIVFIVICVLGIVSFASCRSTSSSCGLADNTISIQKIETQAAKVKTLFVS